ncbi:MAG: cell division protein FtsA [Rhodospirillaceae bacterium]
MKSGVNQAKPRSGMIAALDVGTTKVSCLIARLDGERGADGRPGPRVVGVGHQVSQGMRKGTVVDLDQAEASIRAVVEAAEQMAGENIDRVVVNLSGGKQRSRLIAYEISIAGHEIADSDIRRVLDPANMAGEKPDDREFIHTIPVGYTVDGSRGVVDPRGLFGERLGVNTHIITALRGPLRNLETAVSRCHLAIEDTVVSPYASALGCLSEDEKRMGVTCIDMGGGTTSAAVFFDGEMVHTCIVPVGGEHITHDISRGLVTPLVHAERMKTLYGNVLPSVSDDQQVIQVPPMGDEAPDDGHAVPRSMLVGIIRPRIEEIFETLRDRLAEAGFDKVGVAWC